MVSPDVPAYLGEVDYRATSLRPQWDELPPHVHAATEATVGSPLASASAPVASGFTSSYAGLISLGDGRQVFVKVAGPSTPFVVEALTQEAKVLAELPDGIPAPGLVGSAQSRGWSILVLDALEGHLPGLPWTQQEAESVHDACLRLVQFGTPSPVGLSGNDFASDVGSDAHVLATADAMSRGAFTLPEELPGWVPTHLGAIARLARRATTLGGSSLVHGDLRPDNLLISPDGQATILDWNWLCTGPAWVDFAGLLPWMALQGLDADAWVARSPLLRDVDPDEVDSFLATIAVYMVSDLDQPPFPGGTSALRRHQHLMARTFLTWLGHRRGWDR